MQPLSFCMSRSDAPDLHVRILGEGELTCVLLHGFGEGGFIWDEFIPTIALHSRILIVDLRGHGNSGWDREGRYDIATHCDDVSHIISSYGSRHLVLIGHSMGGHLALRLAATFRHCVVGLAIVDYGPETDPEVSSHIRAEFNSESRIYKSEQEYLEKLLIKRPLANPDIIRRFARQALKPCRYGDMVLKRDPAMGRETTSSVGEVPTGNEQWHLLGTVECPTLVIRGIGSAVLSSAVLQRMLVTIRNGQCQSVDGAGHGVMTDNPQGFADSIMPFIRRILATTL
jgi:pimeloyl-ACP methyl ester carboxylesterase